MSTQDYRVFASKHRTGENTIDVKAPSGYVWKMKTPPIQEFILAGKLPAALTAKLTKIATEHKDNSEEAQKAMLAKLTPDDFLANLAFGRDLLVHCAVDPKISLNPTSEDEISPEEIIPEDFMFLIGWVMRGGTTGESLDSFRPE